MKKIMQISFIISCFLLNIVTVSSAKEFRFTVTSDNRSDRANFHHALAQINKQVKNEGTFHVSPGDLDLPYRTFRSLKTYFGDNVRWYPVIGNHDEEKEEYMQWFRNYYYKSLIGTVNEGPQVAKETCYSWDYENVHFVVLNLYLTEDSDRGGYGNASDTLLNWLKNDLASTDKPFIFVFGHEPAFPKYRHVGDSLDQYPANRNRFWNFLEYRGVTAYICGHIHYYYTHTEPEGSVMQISAGIAGWDTGDGSTFMDITVTDTQSFFNIWKAKDRNDFILSDTLNFNQNKKDYVQTILIDNGADDAQETNSGEVILNATDLKFLSNKGIKQLLGLRFNSVFIPNYYEITDAYLEFTVEEPYTDPVSLTIWGEKTLQALPFETKNKNISSRQQTKQIIQDDLINQKKESNNIPTIQTPNIAAILNEIIHQENWKKGNSLALIISGENELIAEAFEGHQKLAPKLHIKIKRTKQ